MKTNTSLAIGACVVAVVLAAIRIVGCGINSENRTPTAAEMKTANATRFKYIETLPIATEDKKTLESHMGGPPYADPRIAAQIEAAKARGVKISPKVRQF